MITSTLYRGAFLSITIERGRFYTDPIFVLFSYEGGRNYYNVNSFYYYYYYYY